MTQVVSTSTKVGTTVQDSKEDTDFRFLQVNAQNHSVTLSLPSKWVHELQLSQHQLMKLSLIRDEQDSRLIVTPMKERV